MLEVVFNNSTAGALKYAKRFGNNTVGVGVKITTDREGNETIEHFEPKPYTGQLIEGSTADIAAAWLMADVGDISDMPASRLPLFQSIAELHWDDDMDGWPEKEVNRIRELVIRLQHAARSGESVRIWWSDAPEETAGFYWAMDMLKEATGPVSSIKIPLIYPTESGYISYRSTGELEAEQFPKMLTLERRVEQGERKALSSQWRELIIENTALRAMINGHLCSVPDYFYDYVLQNIMGNQSEMRVAQMIGRALTKGPGGVSDWWYAWRLKAMIASGQIQLIKEEKRFYSSTIKVVREVVNG